MQPCMYESFTRMLTASEAIMSHFVFQHVKYIQHVSQTALELLGGVFTF